VAQAVFPPSRETPGSTWIKHSTGVLFVGEVPGEDLVPCKFFQIFSLGVLFCSSILKELAKACHEGFFLTQLSREVKKTVLSQVE